MVEQLLGRTAGITGTGIEGTLTTSEEGPSTIPSHRKRSLIMMTRRQARSLILYAGDAGSLDISKHDVE
ncbi:hypothetical protein CI610_03126 [invertebrate metagenome]|uniref:Uncharacterized protein n=1 Tax=invertebrate metagenome TaxID=1711999 RepID=A0A2H9T413_9ZZZZ